MKTKPKTMKYTLLVATLVSLLLTSCGDTKIETPDNFDYNVTQFEDIKIISRGSSNGKWCFFYVKLL